MKTLYILIAILLLAINLNAKNLIFLTLETPYKLSTSNKNQIWIENKKILNVHDYGKYLTFFGKSKGSTKVHIGDTLFTFIVGNKEEQETYLRLKSILRFNPLLTLEYEKEKFILTGTIKELSEWKTLRALNLNNWLLKTNASNTIILELQTLLNNELAEKNTSFTEIYMSPFPSIRITKNFAKDNSRALDIIKMYGLNIILDDELMMSKPLITVKLTLLEISKSSLMELGIKLPNQYSAQLESIGKMGNGAWTSEANLQILENKGVGQILASPVLLTNSGAEAEFLAGGEIPIKIFNNKSKDVIWKKYGINLKVKPTVDSQGHIKMDIETEISSLDPKRNVDGIPALLTNKIQSHFELQNSQTIILSGLIKNIRGETTTGWPWLADIPILGALFSSSEFRQEKTEMIILVTPEIKRN